MSNLSRIFITIFCIAFISLNAKAQEDFEFVSGPYQIYYSVFNSTVVPPEVAKAAQLRRGNDIALLNISVRKNIENGNIEKHAVVKGTKSDLIHHIPLDFVEMEERGAIYYLASFKFNHKEMLHFNVDVQPDRNRAPFNIKFSRTLYHEGKK